MLKNSQVLAFIARFWLRRPWLLTGTMVFVVLAISFDLATPWAAGKLVDAVTSGPSRLALAWRAWATFVGVYFAFSMIRNLSIRFWIPLASANMKEMTDEGFKKVQSFSADWHADPTGLHQQRSQISDAHQRRRWNPDHHKDRRERPVCAEQQLWQHGCTRRKLRDQRYFQAENEGDFDGLHFRN